MHKTHFVMCCKFLIQSAKLNPVQFKGNILSCQSLLPYVRKGKQILGKATAFKITHEANSAGVVLSESLIVLVT